MLGRSTLIAALLLAACGSVHSPVIDGAADGPPSPPDSSIADASPDAAWPDAEPMCPSGTYDKPCEPVTECEQNNSGPCPVCLVRFDLGGGADFDAVAGPCCAVRTTYVSFGAPDAAMPGAACCTESWVEQIGFSCPTP